MDKVSNGLTRLLRTSRLYNEVKLNLLQFVSQLLDQTLDVFNELAHLEPDGVCCAG